MAIFDDEPKKPARAHEIGQDLSLLSVGELEARIAILAAEIERLEVELKAKDSTRTAAEALFRRT
ncbi:MAG: DUF1192 domain-containing protein [Mesorhizobium sp.]|jgi:uncharacterized small protein (DUF1192 family)